MGTLESTLWTNVEANTGIICACLPAFKTPMKRVMGYFFPCTTRSILKSNSHHSTHTQNGKFDFKIGDIKVRTDVDVQFEHNSCDSFIVGHGQQCIVEAHELA
jgi:hypothetical protein